MRDVVTEGTSGPAEASVDQVRETLAAAGPPEPVAMRYRRSIAGLEWREVIA
jgi:hypothetical protein